MLSLLVIDSLLRCVPVLHIVISPFFHIFLCSAASDCPLRRLSRTDPPNSHASIIASFLPERHSKPSTDPVQGTAQPVGRLVPQDYMRPVFARLRLCPGCLSSCARASPSTV
ncbi:uncharacterized protein EI90DRAFT_2347680 [Cantharellus anzutake]|uniref:uncharacterized protein n=1 Tax=Cantharellus anzutake TaxID=1750568 RepID=UPI00190521F5|nr:uncharacterized protein EI90DRAFT_2347680 [Cantharellus anzutake]KAF8324268.1 hypothetical protein EI90DRAFT_2347680 [Cantharellus anzutake]